MFDCLKKVFTRDGPQGFGFSGQEVGGRSGAPMHRGLFSLMLLRGKAWLRMPYSPAGMATLQHAAIIYTSACDAALAGLSTDIFP